MVGTWYKRSKLYEEHRKWKRRRRHNKGKEPKAKDFAERIPIQLSPLPYMERASMSTEEQQQSWRRLLDISKRRYPTPEHVLGLERLQEQDPHTRPRRTKRSCAPWAHFCERGA